MLSSLPKLADRTFVLGELLPTLLFAIALLFLFRDQPTAAAWIDAVTEKSIGWQGVYFLLAVWASAVLLLVLNHFLYRFLEGYELPQRLAERRKEWHRRRLRAILDELKQLYAKCDEQADAFPLADRDRIRQLAVERMTWLPSRESDVLPTRFGNAIRAFEVYPRDIYGADGVSIWLRLGTVIPKAFAEQIEGVRSQIDFLINCCMFSVIIVVLGFCRMLNSANWHELRVNAHPSGFLHFISTQ
jgi:MFS family permease